MTPKQLEECNETLDGYIPHYKREDCFKDGYQAALESEGVKKLVEALKMYAQSPDTRVSASNYYLTEFPEFARKALAEFEGEK